MIYLRGKSYCSDMFVTLAYCLFLFSDAISEFFYVGDVVMLVTFFWILTSDDKGE